jgi:putative lipoprotein
MKFIPAICLSLSLAFLAAGCGSVDLTPPGLGDRVVEGAVTFHLPGPMPDDAEVTVKVMDFSKGEGRGEVLGEQTIVNPSKAPVPFRIEYRAEDAVLRRGLSIDARIAFGKKLAYYTASAHPLTSANENEMHLVEVVPSSR